MRRGSYVDGVLLIAASALAGPLSDLGFAGRPTVSIGYSLPNGCAATVHADDRQGAHAATQHLINLGHQRIGVISATRPITALTRRLEGYRDALSEAELPDDPALLAFGDFSPESGYQAAAELLAQQPRPTAIFAFNDRMAMGAIRHVRDAGLSVPQDIAVIGFDDIPAAALADPPLTTVRQPALQMGSTAARLLLDLVQRTANEPLETILPTELIVRETCGALARALHTAGRFARLRWPDEPSRTASRRSCNARTSALSLGPLIATTGKIQRNCSPVISAEREIHLGFRFRPTMATCCSCTGR